MKLLKLKEYDTSTDVTGNDLILLKRYLDKQGLSDAFEVTPNKIRASSYVGVIRCHNLQVEVLPKLLADEYANDSTILRNLLYMLSYTRKMEIKSDNNVKLNNSKNPFLEILIHEYATSLFDNLKKQTPKTYIHEQNNLSYMKGKLNFSQHIKYNSTNKAKFYCEYDEFAENNILNQLFLYVSSLLHQITTNNENKKILKQIMNFYADIEFVRISSQRANKIKLFRNQQLFQKAFDLAKMFLSHLSIDFSRNKIENITLLWDMNVLFEEYVFEIMRRKCPEISVTAQKGKKLLVEVESNHKRRNTFVDILVEKGNEKIIVDTKYKKFESLYDFSNADVFQVSTYCLLHDTKKAILIYPQWSDDAQTTQICHLNAPQENYTIQFSTVNLRKDLRVSNIEDELINIINQN